MVRTERLDFGSKGVVFKDKLTSGDGTHITVYRPHLETGELPSTILPGLSEVPNDTKKYSIVSALNGRPSAVVEQPRSWRVVTPGAAKKLRTETALDGLYTVNDHFDSRGVEAIPHSLGGIDFALLADELSPQLVPRALLMNIAGRRKAGVIAAADLMCGSNQGALEEAIDLGLVDGPKSVLRFATGGPQLGAEGLYAAMTRTEPQLRKIGSLGIQLDLIDSEADHIVRPELNIDIEGENIRSHLLRSTIGARACHNMMTCNPEAAYARMDEIRQGSEEYLVRRKVSAPRAGFVLSA